MNDYLTADIIRYQDECAHEEQLADELDNRFDQILEDSAADIVYLTEMNSPGNKQSVALQEAIADLIDAINCATIGGLAELDCTDQHVVTAIIKAVMPAFIAHAEPVYDPNLISQAFFD